MAKMKMRKKIAPGKFDASSIQCIILYGEDRSEVRSGCFVLFNLLSCASLVKIIG